MRLKLTQTSGNQRWKRRHERQRKWNQRKRKSGRWGGAGWMGVCRENPPELVIRLALLLHLWWRRSGFWMLACKDTGVDAEEARSVKRPAWRPWTLSTVNACYSIFQLHKLLHNRKPILLQTDVSYGKGTGQLKGIADRRDQTLFWTLQNRSWDTQEKRNPVRMFNITASKTL